MAPIFGPSEKKPLPPAAPISWVRNRNGNFYKFVTLRADRAGIAGGGVFAIWHSGAKPRWVMVGESDDLPAKTIGGLTTIWSFNTTPAAATLSWALIPSAYRAGIVKYLQETMKPLIERGQPIDDKVEPIPVLALAARTAQTNNRARGTLPDLAFRAHPRGL